uniref:Uncharacterized protein n=1 Tax=Arundo donax TaxID=35708 RepID=A0A0A9CEP9_ARUDO
MPRKPSARPWSGCKPACSSSAAGASARSRGRSWAA